MVLILDGNLLHVAHVMKIGFVPAFGTNQKPYTGLITEIAPYVRTYL